MRAEARIIRRRLGAMLVAFLVATPGVPALAACIADSGDERATLVELYTSEGCSSCPPADRRLGTLTHAGPKVVPLALHVDYWDSIGWKDPFAQPSFAERQAWEVHANRRRTSYTPHFFVNGREVLDWRADLAGSLQPSKGPAAARILLAVDLAPGGRLRVQADGRVTAPGRTTGPLQLFVVVTESGLRSQVEAGENRGALLEHDAVVRNWMGPIPVQGGNAHVDRVVAFPQSGGGHIAVAAFVQDANTAEVLQAVDTGTCRPG